jgi:hypothetical protein
MKFVVCGKELFLGHGNHQAKVYLLEGIDFFRKHHPTGNFLFLCSALVARSRFELPTFGL